MNITRPELVLDSSEMDLGLIFAPPKDMREESQAVCFNCLVRVGILIPTQILECWFLGPGSAWENVDALLYILESSVDDPLFQFRSDVEFPSCRFTGLPEVIEVLHVWRVIFEGSVVTPCPDGGFLDFEVSTWL